MNNKLFLIGVVVAVALWAAYFVNVAGFRDFVDSYQDKYSQPRSGIPQGPPIPPISPR